LRAANYLMGTVSPLPLTWIVTDAGTGHEAQGIAVAEALGFPFNLKRVQVRGVLRWIPPRLQLHLDPWRLLSFVSSNEPLRPPWPKIIVSIGRRSVPIALALKRLSGHRGDRGLYQYGDEATGTGKPVYVQRLRGRSRRNARFHALMRDAGATRPFNGRLERWSYTPINDTQMVANLIRSTLGLNRPS
jgi:mitochondrial fission protein ELM1